MDGQFIHCAHHDFKEEKDEYHPLHYANDYHALLLYVMCHQMGLFISVDRLIHSSTSEGSALQSNDFRLPLNRKIVCAYISGDFLTK